MASAYPPRLAEEWIDPERIDAAKDFIMAELNRFVESGGAALQVLENGDVELRLITGEVFHFGDERVTRIV